MIKYNAKDPLLVFYNNFTCTSETFASTNKPHMQRASDLDMSFTQNLKKLEFILQFFRWFKFTLKTPNSMARGNFFSAIWDISHWNFFVKFGLKTPYDIS